MPTEEECPSPVNAKLLVLGRKQGVLCGCVSAQLTWKDSSYITFVENTERKLLPGKLCQGSCSFWNRLQVFSTLSLPSLCIAEIITCFKTFLVETRLIISHVIDFNKT